MKRHTPRSSVVSLCILAVVVGLLYSVQPAFATVSGANFCLRPNSGLSSLVCTANDVSIARATPISPTTCVEDTTFNLVVDLQVRTTATTRYDIGLYFDTSGDDEKDGARTGVCSLSTLPNAPLSAGFQNKDGDFCGDTVKGDVTLRVTIPNVTCTDTDGDGKLNLPYCTSWEQNAGPVCAQDADAKAGAPSKCKCDDSFNVDVDVTRGELSVAKAANPTSVPETGGNVTFTVTVTNDGDASVTLSTITDDEDNDGDVDTTYQASTICAATVLAPDASTTCTFIRNISGAPGSVTDKACARGTDSHGTPLEACGTATVTINNVAPTASVTKTVVGTVCATVRYSVSVKNESSEAVTLDKLCDNQFGMIAGIAGATCPVSGSIPSADTDCAAGGSIAAGVTYSCEFQAEVCTSGHQNTVTATVTDNDSSSSTASGSATVTQPPSFLP